MKKFVLTIPTLALDKGTDILSRHEVELLRREITLKSIPKDLEYVLINFHQVFPQPYYISSKPTLLYLIKFQHS